METDGDCVGSAAPRAATKAADSPILPQQRERSFPRGRPPIVIVVAPDPADQTRLVELLSGSAVVLLAEDADDIRSLLPHSTVAHRPVLEPMRGLVVDLSERRVRWRGCDLVLTSREMELFALLCDSPGRVWLYQELHTAVWGTRYLRSGADLQSAIKRLRTKLRKCDVPVRIESVRGVGFRFSVSCATTATGEAGSWQDGGSAATGFAAFPGG